MTKTKKNRNRCKHSPGQEQQVCQFSVQNVIKVRGSARVAELDVQRRNISALADTIF